MGYSNFKKIQQVTQKFGLSARIIDLFGEVKPVQASAWLAHSLTLAYKAPTTTEKAKSERLVSPVLMELVEAFEGEITLFSGEEINIDGLQDLTGPCGFFFGLHPLAPYIETPVVSVVEAKDEDIEWGLAQCSAQMYAAHLLNEQAGKTLPALYGCATDGAEWHFIKFENGCFYMHLKPLTEIAQILGTWYWIIEQFVGRQG